MLLKRAGCTGAHLFGYPLGNSLLDLDRHATGGILVAGGSIMRLDDPDQRRAPVTRAAGTPEIAQER